MVPELSQIVEALLFATHDPLSAKQMARAIRLSVAESSDEEHEALKAIRDKQITETVALLIAHYEETNRAFTIIEKANGWKVYTKPEFAPWVRELFPSQKPTRLSPPALETLAIVAYRQPLTKSDIEAVRGVSVDGVLQTLLDRGLATVAGRAELPGRPLLYGTTELFLDHFGIKRLEDLPNAEELKKVELPSAAEDAAEAPPEEGEDPEIPEEAEKAAEDPVELEEEENAVESSEGDVEPEVPEVVSEGKETS